MVRKQQVTDAEHRAFPILKQYTDVANISVILGHKEGTINAHITDPELPSTKKAKRGKRGRKPNTLDPYRDQILRLLQDSGWDIRATSIHAELVKKHGVQCEVRLVQHYVKNLKIDFGKIKIAPETKPIRHGKRDRLTDDQKRLILQLDGHFMPKIIAEAIGCNVSTIYDHLEDRRLPSEKKQALIFNGRQPSPEKIARQLILLVLLYFSGWSAHATELHAFIQKYFPKLNCHQRTIQREVKKILVLAKVPQKVYAMRKKDPGKMMQLDMTDVSDLGVTINRQPFPHRFAIATLTFSCFIHCEVIEGGESFAALQMTLLNAIAKFKGVPELIQTDSLSAAYRNQTNDPEQDTTESYHQLCQFLGSLPIRINPGCAHENGSTESMNRHFAADVKDALVCRGSADFASVADYHAFVAEVRDQRNEKKKSY